MTGQFIVDPQLASTHVCDRPTPTAELAGGVWWCHVCGETYEAMSRIDSVGKRSVLWWRNISNRRVRQIRRERAREMRRR